MTKTLQPVNTSDELPSSTSVVIIGGGIVGVSAALALAERNIPVVLLEKGHIAGEQSSRNLGWIRKTSRHAEDVPLAQAADNLWAQMSERIGIDVGYRQAGIMFLARTREQMAMYETWHQSVRSLELDSRLLTPSDIDRHVPGGKADWQGGVYTPSDGRAEPAIATSAMAKAAVKKGAKLIQNCAVRTLSRSGGKVTGVVTEAGEIRCDQVLLAGGAWSGRFLKNAGVSLPTLPLICSYSGPNLWMGRQTLQSEGRISLSVNTRTAVMSLPSGASWMPRSHWTIYSLAGAISTNCAPSETP